MSVLKSSAFALLLATASLQAQYFQDDFDGTSLNGVWEVFPQSGTVSVSGGLLHLAAPLGYFPLVRISPAIVTPVSSLSWVVEVRMAWPNSNAPFLVGSTRFAATQGPLLSQQGSCGIGDPDSVLAVA